MRACEISGELRYLAALGADSPVRRPITLRDLNRMKKRRKRQERERAAKAPFIARMYGDPSLQADAFETALAQEEERREIEMLKRELELIKSRIAVEIDGAEIDAERKERIAQGAMRAIKRTEDLKSGR